MRDVLLHVSPPDGRKLCLIPEEWPQMRRHDAIFAFVCRWS
jgi:hypothetical protein